MKPPTHSAPVETEAQETVRGFEMRELIAYFLRLGTLGFGGPIALVGYMQKDLVEERHWFSKDDYLQGLAFCQLSPGSLAAQLAFILPSFVMVVVLAALYVRFGSLSWIQGVFYGVGAAVIAIIARSAVKLIRTTLGQDWILWIVFAAMAITTAWKESEIVWL